MTRSRTVACAALFLLCVLPICAQEPATTTNSVVPTLVRFSGVLVDPNGNPMTGVVGVTFYLYKDAQSETPLWMETQNVRPDTNGRYSVQLGSTKLNGLPTAVFASGEARWLGVQIEGQPEQTRVLLLSVPYALKAADAETVGGLPPSAFVLAAPPSAGATTSNGPSASTGASAPPPSGAVTGTGTVNKVPLWDTTSDIISSVISQSGTGSTAKIGINAPTPATTLDVNGAGTIRGALILPAIGTATATIGKNSQPLNLTASVFNSGQGTAVSQNFRWQAEPVGNDTSSTSGSMNLLYAPGSNPLTETMFSIASNGLISFAPGQTFPNTGNGTVTSVGSGAGLTGGPIISSGILSIATGGVTNAMLQNQSLTISSGTGLTGGSTVALGGSMTLSVDVTKIPQLNTSNTFSGTQTINGVLALPSTTSSTNGVVTLGGQSFLHNYGTGDTFVGASAGNFSTTGPQNTAVGFQSLASSSTGGYNTATGYGTLIADTIGGANTANGNQALNANTTGGSNTATGFDSLYSNTSGNTNTASGASALYSNTTGCCNTAVGAYAGTSLTSGSGNTFIGEFANTGVQTPLFNATAIGEFATVNQSNAIVLGSINGVGGAQASVNVGIGTTTPSNVFTIAQGAGHAISDGWDTYSSRRWKTNIHTIHGALEKVEHLRGVSYDLKDSGKHEVGVIAEEVGAVVPEVVTWEKNGTDAQGVDYSRLTALLIEATKEQQVLIQEQLEQINAQETKIADLALQVRVIRASLKATVRSNSEVRKVKARASEVR